MRSTVIALLLAAPVLAAAPPKKPLDAHAELVAALEAHMDGNDAKTRRRLAACLKKAEPGSLDASGCTIYLEWWAKGAPQIDKPSGRYARRLYAFAIESYKKKQFALAGAAWRECLGEAEVGTAVMHDCMAMVDLVPKPPLPGDENVVREVYEEGFKLYESGDFVKAREKWLICLNFAPKNGPAWSDCAAGLKKLYEDDKRR